MSESRSRLVRAARELLEAEGVEGVTLRRIARHAGVSHGAPLRHFPGRAALLSAVAAEGYADMLRRADDLPAGPARARLAAGCRGYLAFAVEQRPVFELMFRRDLLDPYAPGLADVAGAALGRMVALVAAAQADGWRRGADPQVLARSLWAALHGCAQLWLWGVMGSTTGIEPVVEQTIAVFLGPEPSEPSGGGA
ncbi:MAG TPA: TetR/AcrR family transcriptional regulator [Streptosporangiaceae bacterium]|jgi:AcrR family transcriptional regulator